MMRDLSQDIRFGARSLAKQPAFATVAVLSLAVGIGVNTAIFSALNSLLFRPLPVRDAANAVLVSHTSFPAYTRYRDRTETFSAVMAFSGARPMSLVDGDRRDQIYAELVTADFFSLANIEVRLGRPFDRDVDRASAPQFVAVLSHAFWQRRFASDPGIIGKTLNLSGRPFTALGVAAPGFTGFDVEASADLWIPLTAWAHLIDEPQRLTSDEQWISAIGRLAPGVTLAQARSAVQVAAPSATRPDQQPVVRRIGDWRLDGSVTDALLIGAGALAIGLLVLALACANVANLLMARAAARQREMSVRVALGASRARLIRLWLTESVMLCGAAGAIGVLFASWMIDTVVAFKAPMLIGQPESPTLPLGLRLDVRILAFTVGLATLTALVVGLLSALQGSRPGVMRAMNSGRAADRRFAPGLNVRSAVIAFQMALSLLLLIPCGLFVRSSLNVSDASPGFSTDRVLLLPVSTEQAGVRVRKSDGFDLDLAERVAALPGVVAATVMDPVPLWFGGNFANFQIAGAEGARASYRIGFSAIAPGYFETLQLPLLRGRDFTRFDNASAPQVAIVNETMARRFWPDGGAIGRQIGNRDHRIEIVGVAKDAKYLTLAEVPQAWLYLPLAQSPSNNPTLSLAARTTGDPLQMRSAIEREVKAIEPGWPAFQFRTLDEGLAFQRLVPRAGATLLGVLGLFGLLLASIGVYGVVAYLVTQRSHEMGIRLALGAPIRSVLGLIVQQGMTVCLAGAAAGLAAALAATRLLGSVLYGIGAADPLTYIVAPCVLLGVALLACYLPARRVTRLNALDVLRTD